MILSTDSKFCSLLNGDLFDLRIACFCGECSSESIQILKLYATENDGKKNDITVFEGLVCPAEDS